MKHIIRHGNNLKYLRELDDGSVDIVLQDPPFNSDRSYNSQYASAGGEIKPKEEQDYNDIWSWNGETASDDYYNVVKKSGNDSLIDYIDYLIKSRQKNKDCAYAVYMANLYLEEYRVLKPTGNIITHCDQNAIGILRELQFLIFGFNNEMGDIIWYRYNKMPDSTKKLFMKMHDTLLHFTKNCKIAYFNPILEPTGIMVNRKKLKKVAGKILAQDEHTRYEQMYLATRSVITDIPDINIGNSHEKQDWKYGTQKPQKLCTRFLTACCPPDGVVLDPFAGSGSALRAANDLNLSWIGMDRNLKSVKYMNNIATNPDFNNDNVTVEREYEYDTPQKVIEKSKIQSAAHDHGRWVVEWIAKSVGGIVNKKQSGDKGADLFFAVNGIYGIGQAKTSATIGDLKQFIQEFNDFNGRYAFGAFLGITGINPSIREYARKQGKVSNKYGQIDKILVYDVYEMFEMLEGRMKFGYKESASLQHLLDKLYD